MDFLPPAVRDKFEAVSAISMQDDYLLTRYIRIGDFSWLLLVWSASASQKRMEGYLHILDSCDVRNFGKPTIHPSLED